MRTSLAVFALILLGPACRAGEPTLLATLPAHKGPVRAVAFSPSGDLLASAGDDGVVRLWKKPDGKNVGNLIHGSAVVSLAFSEDGQELASGGDDGSITVWKVRTGKMACAYKDRSGVITLSTPRLAPAIEGSVGPEEETLAITLAMKDVRDPDSGEHQGTFVKFPNASNSFFFVDLQVTFEGGMTAIVNERHETSIRSPDITTNLGEIRVSDGSNSKVWTLKGHQGHVNCLAACDRGAKLLASGSDDGSVRLWDIKTLTNTATITCNQGAVYGLAFSPNGRVLTSAGADGTVKFWRIPDGLPEKVGGPPMVAP
jgi:WD40 repeat protein